MKMKEVDPIAPALLTRYMYGSAIAFNAMLAYLLVQGETVGFTGVAILIGLVYLCGHVADFFISRAAKRETEDGGHTTQPS